MKILAVIPARYASQRFPGKPLQLVGGIPMVQCVYEAASQCSAFDEVVVATDDLRIADAVRAFNGNVEMTREDHATGTDRVAEAASRRAGMDVVVNVQGDQPFVDAVMLEKLVSPYEAGESPEMTTLACPLSEEAHGDPNSVKVLCDRRMHALYFSRASVPYYRQKCDAPVFHHLGLYAFRADFLPRYADLDPTPFEQCEQLEQLRVLEHGFSIRVELTEKPVLEINTPEDLERANRGEA